MASNDRLEALVDIIFMWPEYNQRCVLYPIKSHSNGLTKALLLEYSLVSRVPFMASCIALNVWFLPLSCTTLEIFLRANHHRYRSHPCTSPGIMNILFEMKNFSLNIKNFFNLDGPSTEFGPVIIDISISYARINVTFIMSLGIMIIGTCELALPHWRRRGEWGLLYKLYFINDLHSSSPLYCCLYRY